MFLQARERGIGFVGRLAIIRVKYVFFFFFSFTLVFAWSFSLIFSIDDERIKMNYYI